MKQGGLIILFGITEILIGATTLIAVIVSLIFGTSTKPPEVLLFVLTTSIISSGLGAGILRKSLATYHLLLFFSTIIIFSKLLIFARIISLSGALETMIPSPIKNTVSVIYHSLIIIYFSRPGVKRLFGERRDALFSLRVPFLRSERSADEKN